VKQTDDRGYLYPECDPPFVKDAADLPEQLKTLATQINDDVTALQAQVVAFASPPGAIMDSLVNQVLAPNDTFALDNVLFDNDAMAEPVFDRFTVQTSGLYVVTGSCTAPGAPSVFHNLSLRVSGSVVRTCSMNPNLTGGDPLENNVVWTGNLSAGNTQSIEQNFTGAATITYTKVTLGLAMVVPV
jgi:hypothetical protein